MFFVVRKYQCFLFLILTCLSCQRIFAAPDWLENSSWNGFISAGATYTDNPDFGFRAALANNDAVDDSWNFTSRTNGGLQWRTHWNEQWSSTAQVVYEKHTASATDTEIRMATLSYQPNATWLYRIGRFSPKTYMLTDTRSVAYGYLWTYAPMEFYGPLETRYLDGIEVNYSYPTEVGVWKTTVGAGTNKLGVGYDTGELNMKFNPSMGIVQEFSNDSWNVQGAISFSNISNQIAQPVRDIWQNYSSLPSVNSLLSRLDTENSQLWFYSLGVSYHDNDWLVQSEISRLDANNAVIPDYLNGYLSIGKRFGAWTPYMVYGRSYTLSGHRYSTPDNLAAISALSDLNMLTEGLLNSAMNQQSIGVGCRWDVTSRLALKFQVDRKFIEAGGATLWWHTASSRNGGVVDVVTFNVDYTF